MSMRRSDGKRLKYADKESLIADAEKLEATMGFPITPVNQLTGEPDETAQKQTCWVDRDMLDKDEDGDWSMSMPVDEFLTGISDVVNKTKERKIR